MNMMFPGFHEQQVRAMASDQLSGVWNAIVTNNKDPDKLGRVKVKFPLREGELESDWIRIATLMGGPDRGSLFIPEVNDEVLVAFLMGRLDRPVVIGCLWSDKQKPPTPADNNDIRQIKTRGGHEITFQDKNGDGKVTLKTKKGHLIEFSDKDDKVEIKTSTGQQQVLLEGGSANKVTVKCGSTASMTMTAQGDVTVNGQKSVTIKGAQVNIEAQASLSLKASGMLDIKSDGMINIKGTMVKIN